MFVLPWLSLTAPVVDLADPPPRPVSTPPKGASRLELATGLSLVDDIGWEFDLGVVGAGYMVASKSDETSTSHTVWTRLQATHYMPAESEMVAAGPRAARSIDDARPTMPASIKESSESTSAAGRLLEVHNSTE